MLIVDVALIYKTKNGLYSAISKKQGKIIFSFPFFKIEEAITRTYFFVEYEYLKKDFQQMLNKNRVVLPLQDMTLVQMLDCHQKQYEAILIFNYIFDYFLEYAVPVPFFGKICSLFTIHIAQKSELISFICSLFVDLQCIDPDELTENETVQLSLIKEKCIEQTPFLKEYIERIFRSCF